MREIVKMQFGSVVYGTDLPESDLDFKGCFVPSGYDIVMGKIQNSIQKNKKENKEGKNKSGDIDFELYAISYYLKLLCQGQTVAIDMIFTPSKYWEHATKEWEYIVDKKSFFISKAIYPFIGYCRGQASKYSIKGSRIKEAKTALAILEKYHTYNPQEKMAVCFPEFDAILQDSNFIKIIEKENVNGVKETYLQVCEKQIPKGSNIKTGYNILARLVSEYGKRTLQTEEDTYDRKALYHAVRISMEALELLNKGEVTFPRPEVDLLMKIRLGELEYDYLQELLDQSLKNIDLAMEKSTLPVKPDSDFADSLIYWLYKTEILKGT